MGQTLYDTKTEKPAERFAPKETTKNECIAVIHPQATGSVEPTDKNGQRRGFTQGRRGELGAGPVGKRGKDAGNILQKGKDPRYSPASGRGHDVKGLYLVREAAH